jgi:hypothetical protein
MAGVPFTPWSPAQVTPTYFVWDSSVQGAPAGIQFFDACLRETHNFESQVTEHSVEQGVAIVDHVRPLPIELSFELFVSDTPIYSNDSQLLPMTLTLPKAQEAGLITGLATKLDPGQAPSSFLAGGTTQLAATALQALGIIPGPPTEATVLVQQFDADHPYVAGCLDALEQLRDTATLITVHSPKRVYQNMVIKKVTMERSPQTGSSGATFNIDLREIRIVTSQIVSAPVPSVKKAAPTLNKGKQDNAPIDDGTRRSLAAHYQDTGKFGVPLLDPALAALGQGVP